MGRKLITIAFLILCSCKGKAKPDWAEILGEKYGNPSVHIFIPLENSCSSCQIHLGEWLSKNHLDIEAETLQLILLAKDDYILQDYKEQYLSLFPNIVEDKEIRFLNSDYLEGEYPYFKIKLIELKAGELIQNLSLEPGPQLKIYNQLDMFFKINKEKDSLIGSDF